LNFLQFDFRKVLGLALLVAFPLISVNMQKEPIEGPSLFRPFLFVAGLSHAGYSGFSQTLRETVDLYLNLIDIKTNNRVLQGELTATRTQLGEMAELRLENERLLKLLGFKEKTKMEMIAARVIGRDLFEDYESIMINRGESNGVQKGMAVITAAGVVGYVILAEPLNSQVLLVTDRYAVIDGLVQRSRTRGILSGLNESQCALKYLKRSDDVQVGDQVVTSGLDNIFPKGFPVGTVTEVVHDEYSFEQQVTVEPIVKAANIEEVFVVTNAQKEDFEVAPPVTGAADTAGAADTGAVPGGSTNTTKAKAP
jgi:rod shape-determining protein MreC